MRDMSKFGRAVSRVSRKAVAIAIAFAMSIPNAAYANAPVDDTYESGYESEYQSEYAVSPEEHLQEIIDEAKALGVPDAFIRHYLASEFANGKIEKFDGMGDVINAAGADGLEIKDVKLAKLAQNKIDLGEFDFGDYKAGNMVYNFLASKKLKGKAYIYVDDATTPAFSFTIKRSADEVWNATKSLAVDVRDANLTGKKHLYLQVVADSVLDDEGNVNPDAKGKGSLYLESLFFTEGSTPVVSFDIDDEINTVESINGSEVHSTLGYGIMNVQVPDGYKSPVDGKEYSDKSYELDYIRGRGNSTWLQSKKPYKVKLDKKDGILGLPANKHWGLLANYFDYTLLRNRYTFYLAEQLGLDYTPNSVTVDVVMDGEYYGSYQLAETVRIDENRVDIEDLEGSNATTEPDITGGYLLQHMSSWLAGEELPEVGYGDTQLVVEKPEYDEKTSPEAKEAQLDYISRYLETIDNAVAATKKEETEGEAEGSMAVGNVDEDAEAEIPAWRDVLDEDSLIKYTLIQDFTMNGDAYSGSTYYYKPRNDKLYCGPVWDFDFVAWGAYITNFENPYAGLTQKGEDAYTGEEGGTGYAVGGATDGEEAEEEELCGPGLQGFGVASRAPWFMNLYENDEQFKENVIKTWEEFSKILKESAKEDGILDQMAKETYMSALANYQVASSYLIDGVSYWGDSDIEMIDDEGNKYTLNYFNEVNRLKNFINHRAAWVDAHISAMNDFGGSNFDYEVGNVQFFVDGELYAEAPINDEGSINEEDIPANPVKEGYVFKGWYRTNQNGEEEKFNPNEIQVSYIWDDDDWFPSDVYAKSYEARFVLPSEIVNIESLSFVKDTIYVPMSQYEEWDDDFFAWNVEGDEDDSIYYDTTEVDAMNLLKVLPFDADIDDITFEQVDKNGNSLADYEFDNSEEEVIDTCGSVSSNGVIYLYALGEMYIKASYKDMSAILKVVAIDEYDAVYPTQIIADKEVKLNVGEYGDVNFKFDVEENVPYYYYSDVKFMALDEDICEFGKAGSFKAKKAGETTILTYTEGSDGMLIAATKVVVEDTKTEPVNPNKPEVKKAPAKGTKLTDKNFIYKITKKASDDGKKAGEVAVASLFNKTAKKATVKTTVKIDGYKYKVTSISNKAFKGAKKLTKVTIGKNVKKIGSKAFYNLKKLTKVTIKSTKITKIGKKAFFKKGKKKLTVKVEKKAKKKVTKLLKKAKCKGYKVK